MANMRFLNGWQPARFELRTYAFLMNFFKNAEKIEKTIKKIEKKNPKFLNRFFFTKNLRVQGPLDVVLSKF